jgi:hypothetical protein
LLIAVVGVIAWITSSRSRRTLNGKPESYWIRSLETEINRNSDADWQALGPEAHSILVTAVELQPKALDKAYARIWPKVWPKLPRRLQRWLPTPMNYSAIHVNAWARLSISRTKSSIPLALFARALKDPVLGVQYNAMACLNRTVLPNGGAEMDPLLPLVVGATQDPKLEVRMVAMLGLGYFTNQPHLVKPVLTNALTDPNPAVRIRAATALYQLDPVAAEGLGALTIAYDCLNRSESNRQRLLAEELLKKWGKPLPTDQK